MIAEDATNASSGCSSLATIDVDLLRCRDVSRSRLVRFVLDEEGVREGSRGFSKCSNEEIEDDGARSPSSTVTTQKRSNPCDFEMGGLGLEAEEIVMADEPPYECSGQEHETDSAQAYPFDGDVKRSLFARSKRASWALLPQAKRGISMEELWRFYKPYREWLEEELWRCESCKQSMTHPGSVMCLKKQRSSVVEESEQSARRVSKLMSDLPPPVDNPPEKCSVCGADTRQANSTRKQMKNLYEVTEHLILPLCEAGGVSYVELLRRKQREKREVTTLSMNNIVTVVKDAVQDLKTVAKDVVNDIKMVVTSNGERTVKDSSLTGKDVDTFVSHWWGEEFPKFILTLNNYARYRCPALCFVQKMRNPMSWCFWICAFCNNQFAIDHALGDYDIMQSSFAIALRSPSCDSVLAVFDEAGEIYKRIWCAFELFVASEFIKTECGKDLDICLANKNGVISQGAARMKDIMPVIEVVANVKTMEAIASVESDRCRIIKEMEKHGIGYEHLDQTLKHIATEGLVAYWQRRRASVMIVAASAIGSSVFCGIDLLISAYKEASDPSEIFYEASGPNDKLRTELILAILFEILLFLVSIVLVVIISSGVPRMSSTGKLPTNFYARCFYYQPWILRDLLKSACCGVLNSKRLRRSEVRVRRRLFAIAVISLAVSASIGVPLEGKVALVVSSHLIGCSISLFVAILYMSVWNKFKCEWGRGYLEDPLFA